VLPVTGQYLINISLQIWEALGNRHPELLKFAENRLWKALIEVATTTKELKDILGNALRDIQEIISDASERCQPHWFRAGQFDIDILILATSSDLFIHTGLIEQEVFLQTTPTGAIREEEEDSDGENDHQEHVVDVDSGHRNEEPAGEVHRDQAQREGRDRQGMAASQKGVDTQRDFDGEEGPHSQNTLPTQPPSTQVETSQLSSSGAGLPGDPISGPNDNSLLPREPANPESTQHGSEGSLAVAANAGTAFDCLDIEEDLTSLDSQSSDDELEENTRKAQQSPANGKRKTPPGPTSDMPSKKPRPRPDLKSGKVKPRPKPKPKPKPNPTQKPKPKPKPNHPKLKPLASQTDTKSPAWISTIEQTVDGHLREVLMLVDDMASYWIIIYIYATFPF
jgi:hypothetical protein